MLKLFQNKGKDKIVNKCIGIALGICTLLCSGDINAVKQPAEPYLLVKPRLCITRTHQDACVTSVYAEWRYLKPVSACLYADNATQPIMCWDKQANGHTDFNVNSADNILLRLKQKKSQKNLLSATIEVMSKGARVKHLRRKKRKAWSLF